MKNLSRNQFERMERVEAQKRAIDGDEISLFRFVAINDYNDELYNTIYRTKYPWWDIFGVRMYQKLRDLKKKYGGARI